MLDSTLKTFYHFRNGQVALGLKSLITRQYDNKDHLIEEKDFVWLNRSHTWDLDGRNTKKYDPKGRLVLDIAFDIKNSKSTISSLNKLLYNQNNQEIVRFEILKKLEPGPKNWTVDSSLAHYNDEKDPKYDTIIITSSYDENGNRITETYGRPGDQTEQVLSSVYSQGVKEVTFSLNAKGDTNIVYSYDKDGSLTRKTTHYKKASTFHSIDTTWYEGNKEVKWVHYDTQFHHKQMKVNEYDAKGNEIREINYH